MNTLPHYLRCGLRAVFVGYNPAVFSAEAGHYYARPGNVFWKQLRASGLVGRTVGPSDDSLLMDELGFGFIDLCPRPTVRADELRSEELREGSQRLCAELEEYQPEYAVICGKGIYQHLGTFAFGLRRAELAKRPYGVQPERVRRTQLYVVPSSSGLASRWHALRLELLIGLAGLLERAEPNSAAER